jgi:hypothetical protein
LFSRVDGVERQALVRIAPTLGLWMLRSTRTFRVAECMTRNWVVGRLLVATNSCKRLAALDPATGEDTEYMELTISGKLEGSAGTAPSSPTSTATVSASTPGTTAPDRTMRFDPAQTTGIPLRRGLLPPPATGSPSSAPDTPRGSHRRSVEQSLTRWSRCTVTSVGWTTPYGAGSPGAVPRLSVGAVDPDTGAALPWDIACHATALSD